MTLSHWRECAARGHRLPDGAELMGEAWLRDVWLPTYVAAKQRLDRTDMTVQGLLAEYLANRQGEVAAGEKTQGGVDRLAYAPGAERLYE